PASARLGPAVRRARLRHPVARLFDLAPLHAAGRPRGGRGAALKRRPNGLGLASALGFGLRALPARHVALDHPALGDARRLAGASAQIIELGPADVAAADDLDRIDDRRIEREDALDPLAEADLADRDARSGPAALAVYLRPRVRVATPRSSHDPPTAALRGSCALPM